VISVSRGERSRPCAGSRCIGAALARPSLWVMLREMHRQGGAEGQRGAASDCSMARLASRALCRATPHSTALHYAACAGTADFGGGTARKMGPLLLIRRRLPTVRVTAGWPAAVGSARQPVPLAGDVGMRFSNRGVCRCLHPPLASPAANPRGSPLPPGGPRAGRQEVRILDPLVPLVPLDSRLPRLYYRPAGGAGRASPGTGACGHARESRGGNGLLRSGVRRFSEARESFNQRGVVHKMHFVQCTSLGHLHRRRRLRETTNARGR
jgi:hypothetical protein